MCGTPPKVVAAFSRKNREKEVFLRGEAVFFGHRLPNMQKKCYLCAEKEDHFRMQPTLNIRGQLMDLNRPRVMGILNLTPDSFYADSRCGAEEAVERARRMLDEGADMLDLGACSTRPASDPAGADEEWSRLEPALAAIRRALPDALLSIDTFRADIARRCVCDYGADLINDVSGGDGDPAMFATVAELRVPYVLTHGFATTVSATDTAQLLGEVARTLAQRTQQLHELGVADVILDPGFGFGKTLEQNYQLLGALGDLMRAFPGYPLLVGISRKSMIHRLLGISPEQALNGTTVLNTIALQAGAHLLRVHDVREAVEAVALVHNIQVQKACFSHSESKI